MQTLPNNAFQHHYKNHKKGVKFFLVINILLLHSCWLTVFKKKRVTHTNKYSYVKNNYCCGDSFCTPDIWLLKFGNLGLFWYEMNMVYAESRLVVRWRDLTRVLPPPPAENMDALLLQCFLHALKRKVKKSELPLLTSTFLRNHMFSCW